MEKIFKKSTLVVVASLSLMGSNQANGMWSKVKSYATNKYNNFMVRHKKIDSAWLSYVKNTEKAKYHTQNAKEWTQSAEEYYQKAKEYNQKTWTSWAKEYTQSAERDTQKAEGYTQSAKKNKNRYYSLLLPHSRFFAKWSALYDDPFTKHYDDYLYDI